MQTLAALCAQPPSHRAFESILHHLMWRVDEANLSEGIAEAEKGLASWEDHFRHTCLGDVWRDKPKKELHPAMDIARSLEWNGELSSAEIQKLLDSPHLAQLSALSLDTYNCKDEAMATILASTSLKNLSKLSLKGNRLIRNVSLEALLSSPYLPQLTHLSLAGSLHIYEQLEQLSHAALSSLIGLRLYYIAVEQEGWTDIFSQNNSFHALQSLELDASRLNEHNINILLRDAKLPQLRHLSLGSTGITTEGMQSFADACAIPPLASLSLKGCKIGPDGATLLTQSPCIKELTDLDLAECELKDKGLLSLIESPYFGQIEHLNLTRDQLSSVSIAALAAAPKFRSLRTLKIDQNAIGDDGMIALVESPHMTGLTALSFTGNSVLGSRGWKILAQSPMAAFFEPPEIHTHRGESSYIEQARQLGMAPHMPPARRGEYLLLLSKTELSEFAAEVGLKGRSKMNKEALAAALSLHTDPIPATKPQPTASPEEPDHTLFPRLRKLLTNTPSIGLFDQIMRLFSQWEEGESREIALDDATEHLASWDDQLRISDGHKTYWPCFPVEPPPPAFRLIKHLKIDGYQLIEELQRQPPDAYPHTSAWKTIKSIELENRGRLTTNESWQTLAQSSHLSALESFSIWSAELDVSHVPEAFNAPSLRELSLKYSRVTKEGVDALVTNLPAGIERFTLFSSDTPEADTYLSLFTSSFLRGTKELTINGLALTEDGMKEFCNCAPLASLETLNISWKMDQHPQPGLTGPLSTGLTSLSWWLSEQTDEGLRALATSPHLTGLTHLKLRYGKPTAEGLEALARAPFAPHLQSLTFEGTQLDDEGVAALLTPSTMSSLQTLHFPFGNTLTSESMKSLANCPSMVGLEELGMTPQMSKEGYEHLAASPFLTSLHTLDCGFSKAEAVKPLLESPLAQQLVHLDLRFCSAADEVVECLTQRSYDRLERLWLSDRLTKEGMSKLAQCQFGSLRKLHAKATEAYDSESFEALSRASYLSHLTDLFFERVSAFTHMSSLSLEAAKAFSACERAEPFATFPATDDQKLDSEVASIMGMSTNLMPQVRSTYLQVLNKVRLKALAKQAGLSKISNMSKERLVEHLSYQY